MTIADYWGRALWKGTNSDLDADEQVLVQRVARTSSDRDRLNALERAIDELTRDFGDWRVPWGEANRLQRPRGPNAGFRDDDASMPVGFASYRWGSLADFETVRAANGHRMYGTAGNSFVAAVEFGRRVRAKAVLVGGQSSHPQSPHFADPVARYASGALRDVWFYQDDVAKHAARTYRPGQ